MLSSFYSFVVSLGLVLSQGYCLFILGPQLWFTPGCWVKWYTYFIDCIPWAGVKPGVKVILDLTRSYGLLLAVGLSNTHILLIVSLGLVLSQG
jgi:hypothetical protein